MTQIVHIANTYVEFEWARSSSLSLEESLSRHSLCLQLQFLPLLYAQPHDIVAVTSLPDKAYLNLLSQTGWVKEKLPSLALIKDQDVFYGTHCQAWGPSLQVQAWAKSCHMEYALPADWETVRLINSKAFSFRYTCLAEAALIENEQELRRWLQKVQGAKVLKTCFGLSGQGHRHLDGSSLSPEILAFCQTEWQQGRPVIGEPWLERVLDFSTQWFIHPNRHIEWIGATRFETDSQGMYQGTIAGPEGQLFVSFESFLKQHREVAEKALTDISELGFFGPVGIDALLYHHPQTGSVCLYPLVEINGRQTMSLVALRLQQRGSPHHLLRLSFQQKASSFPSLLPQQLVNAKGKVIPFRRYLTAQFI